MCNIMCVGEWFGENVLSVKQPHSPHRLQKKRERERERERKVFIYYAHLLWLVSHYILPARLASASPLPCHTAHLAGEAGITLWTLALFYRWQCMIGHHQWASHVQADVT